MNLEDWVVDILVDPITKKKFTYEGKRDDQYLDMRVYLKNTHGWEAWQSGQIEYEKFEEVDRGYDEYVSEIEDDKCIYQKIKIEGRVLDIGGGIGTVREFLPEDICFVSIDPFANISQKIPQSKKRAYKCLERHLNFIPAIAEFLPFKERSFDYVHMRSMLDHVQVPDLALIEANRVLVDGGYLIVGMLVDGGKNGWNIRSYLKHSAKEIMGFLGVKKYKDHHTWHPTYRNLTALIRSHSYEIIEEFWQPKWNDQVVYIKARKNGPLI